MKRAIDTAFEPEVIIQGNRIIYKFQAYGMCNGVFLFQILVHLVQPETCKPQLMEYYQRESERSFRRALIHPEKFSGYGGKYKVT